MKKIQCLNWFSAVLLLLACEVWATPPLPENDGYKQNGVASCAGSTCHGAVRPFAGSNILHNEFITWTREDRHAKAYQVLLNKESKIIARKLGIKAPHTEKICLDCHASNIAAKRRGDKFQLSEGVSCEACHGGSERWLNSHANKKATHIDNMKKGLYPTEDPEARARLCLSCHFGDNNKFVTHQIMGAGHPRLSFELDTFTALMPAHHVVDKDYQQRKGARSVTKVWATGQIVAVESFLQQLTQRGLQQEKLFPELSLYDCHSCHHRMSNLRWSPRRSTGLGPGVVRFHDANFVVLFAALNAIEPQQAQRFQGNTRALHLASTKTITAIQSAITDLERQLPELKALVKENAFTPQTIRSILNQVIQAGLKQEFLDYAAAEQATMSIGAMLTDLDGFAVFSAKAQDSINKGLNGLYKCVEDDEKYKVACFATALKQLHAATKQ